MKVLITGNCGYIGSVLMRKLKDDAKHDIVGADRSEGIYLEDVSEEFLSGINIVIHLAEQAIDQGNKISNSSNTTINFAKLAKASGVNKFIYASSALVYGNAGDSPIEEDHPVDPVSFYAEEKYNTESLLNKLTDDSFQVIVTRNATLFGASENMRWDLVVNNLVEMASESGEIILRSDGKAFRTLMHVEDLCACYIKMLDIEKLPPLLNLGDSELSMRVLEIANAVEAVFEGSRISFIENPTRDLRSFKYSADLMKSILGIASFNRELNTEIKKLATFKKAKDTASN